MRGAIVFLVVFFLIFLATIAYADLPPGKQIYDMLNVASTDYQVLGIAATTFIVAAFNGVVYGIIVWLIYSLVARTRKPKSEPKK